MKAVVLLLIASARLCAQQGSLEGTALNAVTREPLSNVHVRLVAATFTGITGAYGAMSDRTGHFSFASIRPGTYILMPERAGFLHVPAKGSAAIPNITIKPGEHQTGYQLEMTPRAVISGRVVDENGDPVPGVQVKSVPATPGSVPLVLVPVPDPSTDDRGEFRVIGPAGKFYVQATVNTQTFNGIEERPEKRSDGTSEAIYGTTFYPSSLRQERGTVVEAVAGKDVSGIEIRLARVQQTLAISGVVTGTPEGPARGYVMLQSFSSGQQGSSTRSTMVGADGKFRFAGLQPGFYRMWAGYNDGAKTQLASRMMEWQVENAEIANVELVLSPGLELVGTVKMEGEPAGAAQPKRTVKLAPAMGYFMMNQGPTGGEVNPEGGFRIGNIMPGKYRVKVEPLAENAYMKTLEIDGVAVTDGMADLSKAVRGASAKVTLGSNGAQISGHLLDATGERITSSLVMIFLARDPDDIPLYGNDMTQSAPEGKYTIKAVAPGKYRLFALDLFQFTGVRADGDEDFLKKLFARGEEIEFKEGDRITKDLKVLPMEDPNAKPKK